MRQCSDRGPWAQARNGRTPGELMHRVFYASVLLAAIGNGLLSSLHEFGADPGLPLFVDRLRRVLERLELFRRQLGDGDAQLLDLLELRGILGRHTLARDLDAVLAGFDCRLPDDLLIFRREALPHL